MKAFLFSSALLALAVADSCSDCTAVVSTIAARLSSEESIAAQQGILVGGLCPGSEDPAECEAALPGIWRALLHSRAFWSVDSAQAQRTRPNARLPFLVSGEHCCTAGHSGRWTLPRLRGPGRMRGCPSWSL